MDCIKPPSNYCRKCYILIAIEYVNKGIEAIATKIDDVEAIAKFKYENIIIHFGCPKKLVSDTNTHFINSFIKNLIDKCFIKHFKSSLCYPRANGQLKILIRYYKKLLLKLFKVLIMMEMKDF